MLDAYELRLVAPVVDPEGEVRHMLDFFAVRFGVRARSGRGQRRSLAYPWGVMRCGGVSTAPARGYTATKDQLQTRLRRIEGQVRGIQGMVDEDRYCIDVLTQISAIQAALDKVALGLLDDHVQHCVKDAAVEGRRRRWPPR